MNGRTDMESEQTIKIIEFNQRTNKHEETGEVVDLYVITRSITMENFTLLFGQFISLGRKDFKQGKEVGLRLRSAHPLHQSLIIRFALGIISGLSEQYYTERGNDVAISTARQITQMINHGDLRLG